jgi:hypothetical protein
MIGLGNRDITVEPTDYDGTRIRYNQDGTIAQFAQYAINKARSAGQ